MPYLARETEFAEDDEVLRQDAVLERRQINKDVPAKAAASSLA